VNKDEYIANAPSFKNNNNNNNNNNVVITIFAVLYVSLNDAPYKLL